MKKLIFSLFVIGFSNPAFAVVENDQVKKIKENLRILVFLDVISKAEGTFDQYNHGYNTHYCFDRTQNLNQHPDTIKSCSGVSSSAFGRYQILKKTDDFLIAKGLPEDFLPITQDKKALSLIGKKRLKLIRNGNFTEAMTDLEKVWPSFTIKNKDKLIIFARKRYSYYFDSLRGKISKPVRPVKSRNITSEFGDRSHPFKSGREFHTGIDIGAKYGSPIYASWPGKVYASYDRSTGCGKRVTIKHHDGKKTRYCHMSKRTVRKGQLVKRGQIIGHVGSTGASTGPHLHFEIYKDGKFINPRVFINNL